MLAGSTRMERLRGEKVVPRKAKAKGKMKIKTHKATSKRFKVTGSGKLVRTIGPKSHLRRRKSPRTKARLSEMTEVTNTALVTRVRRLAPYL
jgi:large subunit ribosomal protein L35